MRIRVYPGQYYDSETGLHYNWHRDYYPAAGRYVESDPVGLRGGTNIYAYVANNPVIGTDPLGMFTYNTDDTSVTGRLSGDALDLANKMETCIGKSFVVTGGSECYDPVQGLHTITSTALGSKHCTNQAFDMRPSGMNKQKVFCCALESGAGYAEDEGNHWHFQTVPSSINNSSGSLPKKEDCDCKGDTK